MKEFTIGWASVSMIRTRSVVIKKKKSMFGKRDNGVQEI